MSINFCCSACIHSRWSQEFFTLSAGIVSVLIIRKDEGYLGAPMFATSKPISSHKYLIKKMHNKLKGWKGSLLSQVGREVLIKASLVAIPSFHMGIDLLPNAMCGEIEGIMRNFLPKLDNTHWSIVDMEQFSPQPSYCCGRWYQNSALERWLNLVGGFAIWSMLMWCIWKKIIVNVCLTKPHSQQTHRAECCKLQARVRWYGPCARRSPHHSSWFDHGSREL